MEDYLYDGLIERISKEFELQLEKIEAEYNFDNGDEFEIAICKKKKDPDSNLIKL